MYETSDPLTHSPAASGDGPGGKLIGALIVVGFLAALVGIGIWGWHRSQASLPSHIASSDVVACQLITQPQAEQVLGGPLLLPPKAPDGTAYYGRSSSYSGTHSRSVPNDDACSYLRSAGDQLRSLYIEVVPKQHADTGQPSATPSPGAPLVTVRKLPHLGLTGEERSATDPTLGRLRGISTTNQYWFVQVYTNVDENSAIRTVQELLQTPQLQRAPGPGTGGIRF